MSQSLEVEYKTLLDATAYERLRQYFNLTASDFITQTNLYFDTPDGQLKAKRFGLRVRYFEHDGEATLKTPQKVGLLETTDPLSADEISEILTTREFPQHAQHVLATLQSHGIQTTKLQLIAQLKTRRAEFKIPEGKLALDESWYGEQHDYELELEVQDTGTSQAAFSAFLTRFDVPYRPAENKIVRAVNAQRFHDK